MSEKNVTLCNKLLYYGVAPLLLLYFFLIDSGLATCNFNVLVVFSLVIVSMVTMHLSYKKKNNDYKFLVNNSNGKVMMVLVLFELSFNLYRYLL